MYTYLCTSLCRIVFIYIYICILICRYISVHFCKVDAYTHMYIQYISTCMCFAADKAKSIRAQRHWIRPTLKTTMSVDICTYISYIYMHMYICI